MNNNEQLSHDISAIYKLVYESNEIHRNILKKNALKSKIPSKTRFQTALDYLLNNGKLVMNKEIISLPQASTSVGILQRKDDDYFLVVPHTPKKFKVPRSVASGYHIGDILDVAFNNNEATILGRSKKEITFEKSAEHKQKTQAYPTGSGERILGRVIKLSHNDLAFIPNNKSLPARQIPILNDPNEIPAFQDKICIMQLQHADAPLLGGYITELKGEAGNPIHEYDAIAEYSGAIMSWEGEKLQAEIDKIPDHVDVESLPLITEAQAKTMQKDHVVDLRHIPFSTVDPASCLDMDDAIFSTFDENGNIVCYTAASNLTLYFTPYSEIGKLYTKTAFTRYAPNKAYGITPPQLATGINSITPGEVRRVLVSRAVLDPKTGKTIKCELYDAIIESRAKYAYEGAQEEADKLKESVTLEDLHEKFKRGEEFSLEETILMDFYAAKIIKKGFDNRRMIRFVSNNEHTVVFDETKSHVEDILPLRHLFYNEVIEAFMITQNEGVAKYSIENNIPTIFRIHEAPQENKIARASEFFKILGIDFDGDLSASGTRAIIESIKGTAAEEVVNEFLIKMQSRAIYSTKLYGSNSTEDTNDWLGQRISHYALQSPHYCHSTAAIRRSPDYYVHYNIFAHMHGRPMISEKTLQQVAEIANEQQIKVDQAEKDFTDVSNVLYCENHIGEKMHGRITKMRYTSPLEGYEDEIVVIAKTKDKGISAEIPLSQIIGRIASECTLSAERCAVYNKRGEVLLSLCKPIDFIIEKTDRKSMIIVGKTNRELIHSAEQRSTDYRKVHHHDTLAQAQQHKYDKNRRKERLQHNKEHHNQDTDEFDQ